MFYPACERLASEQRELRDIVEAIDKELAECSADAVIEPYVLANRLNASRTPIESILGRLAEYGLLNAVRMIRCRCDNLIRQDFYDEAVEAGEELECSFCHCPCRPTDADFVTVYRPRSLARSQPRPATVPGPLIPVDLALVNATAKVNVSHNGKAARWGTGFLVTDRLVLTAFHVVGERDTAQMLTGPFSLRFGTKTVSAKFFREYRDPRADWAVLECSEQLGIRPLQCTRNKPSIGDRWLSYGFPQDNAEGMTVAGEFRNIHDKLESVRAIHLYCTDAAAAHGMRVPGLSGAPVMANGLVVGLLRWTLGPEGQTVGGALYACPVDMVLDDCMDVLTSV